MKNCLQCSKELIHVPGRKEKSFCDVNCRNKYFYAKRKQEIDLAKSALLSLPADYAFPKKVGILTEKGEIKPIFPKPNKKPKNGLPAEELDKPVEFIKRADSEPYDAPKPPRTLDELKALCPFPEKSDERSAWVRTERQKYGI